MNVAFSCDGGGWRERRGHCNVTLPLVFTGMEKTPGFGQMKRIICYNKGGTRAI